MIFKAQHINSIYCLAFLLSCNVGAFCQLESNVAIHGKDLRSHEIDSITMVKKILDSSDDSVKLKFSWQNQIFNSPEFKEATSGMKPEQADEFKALISSAYPIPNETKLVDLIEQQSM